MCCLIAIMLAIVLAASTTSAQTTGFTYQGRLTDGGTPANGVYDLQFGLWDSQSNGNQIGSTQNINSVQVTSGVFTVTLDFGANAFPGSSRFLAISARVSGPGSFTLLTPRQPITSTPYAVRSLRATTADSVPASGVPAGSGNYIQNSSSPQSVSNFNISGNGTAGGTLSGGVVNAATQFNLGGSRILSNAGAHNLFAGTNAGAVNQGAENAFFGSSAGSVNGVGSFNAFFGAAAGFNNATGNNNSFFGDIAGANNTNGSGNSFFGIAAGQSNSTGTFNTTIGYLADVTGNPTNATAIGAYAQVAQSNSLVLGSINLVNGATADTKVGIGTISPQAPLHVRAKSGNILLGNAECAVGFGAISFASSFFNCTNYALMGGDNNTYINRPLGGTIIFRELNTSNQVEIRPGGTVGLAVLGSAGSTALCLNSIRAISTCSSSLRYKTDVKPFSSGLQLIDRLQPVSFNWKANQQRDVGLIAEEVAGVEPLFTFKNDKGEIEGVKYSNLSVVFINAFKEQQLQIEAQKKEAERQQEQIREQQQQIDSLKRLVCADHPTASICKSN